MLSFHIETVGCQMNALDSELVAAALLREGFLCVDSPKKADIVLFNTCSIRQHAEDKIYSALGRLKFAKQHNPNKIIGVIGCMAQKDNQEIFRRASHVDLVVGPGQIALIPELIHRIQRGEGPQIELSLDRKAHSRHEVESSFESYDPLREAQARHNPYLSYVRAMFGCNQFCSYCIVPLVRGPERSREAEEILAESALLVEQGCREITLIGQTVSKYQDPSSGARLSGLLERMNDLAERTSLERIRFVTSHPNSMTPDLLQAVRDLPFVMPYFHIPAQSGSNAQLKKMNRGYTIEKYREALAQIRETVPGASITSDFIVGFCGETEEDFDATMRLVEESRFKNSYIFKFSPREGTKAFELYEDDVPEEVKRRRNNDLLALQNRISEEDSATFLGKNVEILVEGESKSARKIAHTADSDGLISLESLAPSTIQLTGRTPCDRIVVFDGAPNLVGTMQNIRITKTSAFTLFGEVL
ncbi:MAG: tRNA (N6-isopentenyl adenosine(37)-C2)-methylthiotransferase MiaB [Planctomycetia bacterium]|nr:tRNA (N6-isopentenyl adenosine(37)-C2)-methylthiotransferase MiaB [Planctomycetia bacterium]